MLLRALLADKRAPLVQGFRSRVGRKRIGFAVVCKTCIEYAARALQFREINRMFHNCFQYIVVHALLSLENVLGM